MTFKYRAGESIAGTQYRFVRMLGAGGHGEVYAVEHTFLQAPAVMKLLHPELAHDGDLAQRMTREARTLAQLRHPNLVEVRDGGITAETPGRPFFVMEPLNGMPLRDLLRHMGGRGIGVLPALRIAIGILEGLQHAHRAGVIHRDIKPDNIFLHRTSTDVTVPKVLDFGIAHLLMGQKLTGRHFLGTPRYAAPEQLRGESPSPCTDIYAVGLVLHEMITGQAPFAHLKEIGAILQAHLNDSLPAASSLCSDAPPMLDNFLASMMAKDPVDRSPTAFAAAVALREIRARVEAEQAGSMHTPEFQTEPTPMDNMLFEASPDQLPFVTEIAVAKGGLNDTVPEAPPRFATAPHRPGVPSRPAEPIHGTEPMPAAVAVVAVSRGAERAPAGIDRNARTNTAREHADPVRPTHDTEPLSPIHPALADTTPVKGAVRSARDRPRAMREPARVERTPAGLAIAPRAAEHDASQRAARARNKGGQGRSSRTLVFGVTLAVVCIIGVPLALTRSQRAPPSRVSQSAAPAEPSVAISPLPSPIATAPSATAEPAAPVSIAPLSAPAVQPASSAIAVGSAPLATTSSAPPRNRAPRSPAAAKPNQARAGDPASVPFE